MDRAAAVFIVVIAELMKLPLKECLMKAKYYSFLQDGSTDTTVSEQELIYANGLVVKLLDSQSRGPMFKTTGWLQGRLSLSFFRGR